MTYTNPIVREERLKAFHKKVQLYQLVEDRERCESSLAAFFEGAWPYINSAEYQSGWAIEAMCLPYDSVVMTEEGRKAIGDIVEGGWKGDVLSYDHITGQLGWKRIVGTSKSISMDTVIIRDEKGGAIRLTANHPLYIVGRGYVRAECAKSGERILRLRELRPLFFSCSVEDYEAVSVIIESVEREIPVSETVYNIEVLDNHNYFADGILVHNCDHLEAVVYGHIPRLLINCPPRTSKTSLVSIAFPAWVWAQIDTSYLSGPQVEFLCASYGHTLALDSSNKCRRLIASPWYQERWGHRFQLRYDQNTKFHWENDKGGARIATSVGGTLLGLGGAILLADDLNNTADVESDAERESVKNFWQEFHTTRLNDPKQSAIIAIQQRLHENDNSGLILASGEDWVHLRIPMRYESNYTYHTVVLPQYDSEEPWDDPRSEDGELMWEERFGEKEVEKLESQLGPYLAAGRLQQRPAPKGGGILQREWWQPWDGVEAARYGLEWKPLRRDYPSFELVVGSLDTAYGEKEENDYNALTIWGIFLDLTGTRRAMLAYAWNKRLKLNGPVLEQKKGEANLNFRDRQQQAWGLVEWVADTCKRYHVQRLLIENKTRGIDVANELRRLYSRNDWGIQLVNPQKDKVARAHSVVPLFTDNSIYAPIDRQWCAEVVDQCAIFNKGEHDDLVDSVTQALHFMRTTGLLLRAEEQEAEVNDSIRFYNQEESVRERYGI